MSWAEKEMSGATPAFSLYDIVHRACFISDNALFPLFNQRSLDTKRIQEDGLTFECKGGNKVGRNACYTIDVAWHVGRAFLSCMK